MGGELGDQLDLALHVLDDDAVAGGEVVADQVGQGGERIFDRGGGALLGRIRGPGDR
jgi:hypothetical protein